ncbi:MAG: RagB/SusD family nutrient uptake outer membrane protein [Prevotellaceae bacterium]|jgi:hypothetical protein|nr:RagB/SusD family nutrient uptake outer membrane protein [Prevotellaceae bacterium]
MKNIKSKVRILTSIAAVAMVVNATSCSDFLDQESQIALKEEDVFNDIENIAPLVDGLYTTYRNLRAGREGLMINLGTDESQQGNFQLISEMEQSGMDKYNGLLSPTSPQVAAIWSKRWPVVSTAAKAIDVLGLLKQTDEVKVLTSEAHFFRALAMFELSMFFGEIPIVDIARVTDAKRRPLSEVWTYIIEDFKLAANNLPATHINKKRATSGAAWAMLGKAYMSAPEASGLRDYAKAKGAFEQMMERYSLVPSYAILFANDRTPDVFQSNTSESIFELQFNNIWPDVNYWEFDCGSRAVDAYFGQGCYFSGYDLLLPTPFAYKPLADGGIWEDGDQRKEVNLRYDFTYNGVTPDLSKTSWTETTDELEPHIRKFEDIRTDKDHGSIANMWNSGKNHPLIRLADIYLLYAECLYRTGATGAEGDHFAYVQKVRNRAFGGIAPAMPQTSGDFIKDLMDERVRELCFEGWRRLDLLRTDLFVELVSKRNKWTNQEHGGANIPDFYMRWPIPDDEIKTNDDMGAGDQNPGY